MKFFVRFTDTILEDLERNTSIITTNANGADIDPKIVTGLCAFGAYDSEEQAIEKANLLKACAFFDIHEFSVLTGVESNGIKGSLGTVVLEAKLVSRHKIN